MQHIIDAASYEAPAVKDFGSLESITAGSSTGDRLDQDFPAGTPFSDLTFS